MFPLPILFVALKRMREGDSQTDHVTLTTGDMRFMEVLALIVGFVALVCLVACIFVLFGWRPFA